MCVQIVTRFAHEVNDDEMRQNGYSRVRRSKILVPQKLAKPEHKHICEGPNEAKEQGMMMPKVGLCGAVAVYTGGQAKDQPRHEET